MDRHRRFVLAHRSRHGEADDPPDRDELARIAIEVCNQPVELILGRVTVTLVGFPDEP
jgi:hypothetical protein